MATKLHDEQALAQAVLLIVNKEAKLSDIAKEYGISKSTLHRAVKKAEAEAEVPAVVETAAQDEVDPDEGIMEPGIISHESLIGRPLSSTIDNAISKRATYLSDLFEVKCLILEKIRTSIRRTNNLDALQKALKTISDLEKEMLPEDGKGTLESENVTNVFNYFNQILINQGYEGPKLKDSDIVKGDYS